MKRFLFFPSLMMIVIVALLSSGCSQRPEAERTAAGSAMKASRSAGADRYAPADFAAAKRLWDVSETQVSEKKYQEAKQGYLDAKLAFGKAAEAAEAAKIAMIPEATAALAALEEGWINLEVMVKKAESKTGEKKLWEADLKSFLEGMKAAKEMVKADPAAAKAKAAQLARSFDTFGEYFKHPAANPVKSLATPKRARNRED